MKQQRGGTILGFIIGVVFGLAAALVVAVYVTKVLPVPLFMNKGQSRTADQDEAEARKNKDWNPNAPLYGKNPAKPSSASAAAAASAPAPAPAASKTPASAKTDAKTDAKVEPKTEAKTATKTDAKNESKPAVSADPLGDLVKSRAGVPDAEPFTYFVQLGAFRTAEDAEAQRAKLSLSGIDAKISEREQSGRPVFRVRVGPFAKREDAERNKENLEKSGLEAALVRVVQR